MKYLQTINEKFGIKKRLVEQVDGYFRVIQENPDKHEFTFYYAYDSLGIKDILQKVTVKIGKVKGLHGQYSFNPNTKETTILLSDRNDKSTLLHELKHLDYALHKRDFHKNIFHTSKDRLSKSLSKRDKLNYAQEIFYLLDQNEFESRYHGYFIDFDEFISKSKIKDPTPGEIYELFESFLSQSEDISWTWYVKEDEFKFENYFSDSLINRLFNQFVYTKDFYADEYENMFKYIRSIFKKSYRRIFNSYSDEEIIEIKRTKKLFERKINQRLPKYRKKLFKLVPLMVDKWCK